MRKVYFGLGLSVVALGLVVAPWAQAAEFIMPDRQTNDGNVTVASTETHRNLYLGGSNVTVNGPTAGDLYAAGGTAVINGDVEQDLNSAGGTVVLNGKVGGDARVAGGSVNINGPISGDLLVAAGTVVLGEKASVGGDLIICGGTVTVNAPVAGNVRASGGTITLNSAITGSVKVRAGEQLVFGPRADIAQTVNYQGPKAAIVQEGAKVGPVNFQERHERNGARQAVGSLFTAVFLFKLIAYIIAALLVSHFFKRPAYAVVNNIYQSPWANLGIGFICALVVPIIAVVVTITFIGFYVGLILGLFFILALLLSVIVASMFLGAILIKWLMKKPNLVLDWQAVLIGTVLLGVVGFIPVLGFLICAILVLMALGANLRLFWQWMKQQRGASAEM